MRLELGPFVETSEHYMCDPMSLCKTGVNQYFHVPEDKRFWLVITDREFKESVDFTIKDDHFFVDGVYNPLSWDTWFYIDSMILAGKIKNDETYFVRLQYEA